MKATIKPYACCRYNHGLIDCVLELRETHGLQVADIERIELGVLSGGALLVAEPIEQKQRPKNVVDAQFSAPFAAAVAMVHGQGNEEVYTQEQVDNPVVRDLMLRTTTYRDEKMDAIYPAEWPSSARIHLKDGRTVSTEIPYALGEPENPVNAAGLTDKFVGLTFDIFDADTARALAARLLRLEHEPSLTEIATALEGR
jgi:2-methylcitrate dehydratase PrpD